MARREPEPSPYTFASPAVQYRRPVRGSLIFWLRFFGLVAFLIVLLRLPKSQEATLVHIDLRWLGFCMLLTILQLLLEAFVWQLLLSSQRIRHPYPKTLLSYLASQYLGLVTPGHVGEFLAAGYISTETGITFGYALSSVVMKKVLAWVTIVSFGVWGLQLLALVPLLRGIQWVVVMSGVVLVALSAGIALWVVSLRRLTRKWEKLSPWQVDMTELWSGMRHLVSLRLIVPLGVAALAFSLLFLQLNAVLRSLGIALPMALVAQITSFSRIVGRAIPFSVVGFGTKDAAVIGMLAQHQVDPSIGLTVTLLLLVCSYLVTLLLSGLCWWIKPLVIRRVAPSSS
ncbi:MAG: flippase-like domain-containing protein [Candidatus Omnitrophica bacterium]|nr:flippase-like domain-containing protein [Candidatus Omnitrophota bacterium]